MILFSIYIFFIIISNMEVFILLTHQENKLHEALLILIRIAGCHCQRILLWLWPFQWHDELQLSHFCLSMERIGKQFEPILIPPFSSTSCRGSMIMVLLKVACSFMFLFLIYLSFDFHVPPICQNNLLYLFLISSSKCSFSSHFL